MKLKSKLIVLGALLLLIAMPGLSLYREARRARLNHQLFDAIYSEKYDDALRLVQSGADGKPTSDGSESIKQRLSELIDRVLRRPTDQHHSKLWALQALYLGCDHPDWPVTEKLAIALLDRGAQTEPNDPGSGSYLQIAAKYHHHAFVRKLLSINPKLVIGDAQALFDADATDTATILEYGAAPDAGSEGGFFTPLFEADADKANLLLAHGARVDVRDRFDDTPLNMRCLNGDDGAVAVLLKHHADVNARNGKGRTALLCAVGQCSLETVKTLVAYGANVRERDYLGNSTLMLGMSNQDKRVVPWLLEQGIDVNLVGAGGNTALTIAEQFMRQAVPGSQGCRYYASLIPVLKRRGAKAHAVKQRWIEMSAEPVSAS